MSGGAATDGAGARSAVRQRVASSSLDAWLVLALAILLPMPFYFVTTPSGLRFAPIAFFERPIGAQLEGSGFGLPVAMIAVLPVLALFVLRLAQRRLGAVSTRPVVLAFLLAGWMVVVAINGFLFGERSMRTVLLFAQTILPITVFLAVYLLPVSTRSMKRCLTVIPIVSAVSIVLIGSVYGVFLANWRWGTSAQYLTKMFYGVKNLHPLVVMVALSILLAQLSSRRRVFRPALLWALLVIHAAYLVVLWSRSALLMIGLIFTLWLVDQVLSAVRRGERSRRFWLERGGVTVLMLVFFALSLEVGIIGLRQELARARVKTATQPRAVPPAEPERESERAPVEPEKESEGGSEPRKEKVAPTNSGPSRTGVGGYEFGPGGFKRRGDLLRGGIQEALKNPIFGVSFNALEEGTVVAGRKVKDHRVYPAHNQYVDLAIRSGLPSLLLFLAFLAAAAWALWIRGSGGRGDPEGELARVTTYVVVAAAVGSMFQLFFVVTQTAVLLYLVIALALRLTHSSRPRAGVADAQTEGGGT